MNKFTHPVYYKIVTSIKFCSLFPSMSVSITNNSYKLWWGNHIFGIAELINFLNLFQNDVVTFSYNYILWSTSFCLVLRTLKAVWLSNYFFTFDLEQGLLFFFFNFLKFWICNSCVFSMWFYNGKNGYQADYVSWKSDDAL